MDELKEILEYCKAIDNRVRTNGKSYNACEGRYKASLMMYEKGYKEEAFSQLTIAKNELYSIVKNATKPLTVDNRGLGIFEYHDYCKEHGVDTKEMQLFWQMILLEAPDKFDSYLLYLEKDRQERDRFYLPKRKQFMKFGIIDALQDLEDNKIRLLTISMPPGTQKTTTEKFFASWVFGRHPEGYSLFYSHSDDITRMFYDGVLDICTNDVEYRYKDIFPYLTLESTNAKRQTINFNAYKPFANLQCASVGGKNAGKVRCGEGGYLYCDDLIGGIEEAMSKTRLDALWSKYSVDGRQRKLNEQVKEIHIATRWSVHDVIGRLQTVYLGDKKARFIAIPDIDPKTGKSNFDYKFNGMTEEFFHDQELLMDDISYRCLYKNEPIEREGILYHADELRRFTSLPEREPDSIIAVCDTKAKGTDFMVMPIVYQYDEDYYLVDCICDDTSDYGVQYERLASRLFKNNVQQCEFESNSGGDRVAFEVQSRVSKMGGRCNITSKATETNKETRIIVNADWVKKNILFKDESMYTLKEDYGVLVSWLCRYSLVGKNPHDDVPDALANLALFVQRKFKRNGASAVFNPFRMRG